MDTNDYEDIIGRPITLEELSILAELRQCLLNHINENQSPEDAYRIFTPDDGRLN